MTQRLTNKGIELLKYFEGFRSKPYLCQAGVATIGYGSTFYPDGSKVTLKDPAISKEDADVLLMLVVDRFEIAVDNLVTIAINENQFSALVLFTYNIGVAAFARSTMLRKLNGGDVLGAADEFKRWVKAGGKISAGLKVRRKAERELFLSPALH